MFENKTFLIIILILCLCFVIIFYQNEKFDVDKQQSQIDTELESEFKLDSKTEQELVKCDSESLDSCIICKNAYDNYNLYSSTNPFVVRANDINMNFKNNITNPVVLSDMGTQNYQVINNIINDYNPNDDTLTKKAFDEILTSAPLKTGCCFRSIDDNKQRNVLVRIPLNPNENIDPLLKKFDFKFKSLRIPENSCPNNYYGGSNECNTFFDVYCTNLVNEFNKLNLGLDDFTKFAPECACYAPKTNVQKIYPPTTPPACYKTNCDNVINPIAYIDPISRNNPCDLKICNNIFNANNIKAGGNVNISAKLESSCGDNLPKDTSNNTSSNNSDSNNSGSNNTNSNNTGSNNTDSNNTDSNNYGSDNSGSNNADSNNTGSNNTGSDNTGSTLNGIIWIMIIFIVIILLGSSIYFVVKRK